MSRCVVVAAERAVHIVAVVADMHRNTAAEITAERIRVVVAMVNGDHIDVVAVPNTAGSIHQTSRMRWISPVLTSLRAPVLHEWMDDVNLSIMYSVLCSCRPVSVLFTCTVNQLVHSLHYKTSI